MIQRIQTLYFSLVALCTLLMFASPVAVYSLKTEGGTYVFINNMFYITESMKAMPVMPIYLVGGLFIAVAILSISIVFLFRNRLLQIRLARFLILLLTISISVFYVVSDLKVGSVSMGNAYSTTFLLGAYAPLLNLLMVYLAIKAIKKDEELVRSADRLR